MNSLFRVLTYELPLLLRVTSSRQYLFRCAGISLRKRWFIFMLAIIMIFLAGYIVNLPIIISLVLGIVASISLVVMVSINSFIRHSQDIEISEVISEHVKSSYD